MAQERPLFRPLLPTVTKKEVAPPQRRPRDRITSACEACRQRKTKCKYEDPGDNGVRPECWECRRRSTPCHYAAQLSETQGQAIKRKHADLQRQHEVYAELFSLIQTRPDNETIEIMRRIKMGGDPETILRHVRDGDLVVQMSVEPETRLRYTLPYMDSMPAFLLVPGNQYLDTALYEANFKSPSSSSEADSKAASETSKCMGPYMKPSHAAEVVEPILDRVYARQWTNIISDDGLFRRLITIYLFNHHATFFWFNKELFLEDLAARRTQFCSSLLVNAVLAAACQAYKGIPDLAKLWMPGNLQNRFLLETKRLWDLEMGISRLTNIHAAQVLHCVLNVNGLSTVGDFYLLEAIAMAQNLRIFERPPARLSARLRKGQEFTAWALWLWQVGTTYYYRRAPFIRDTPAFPAYHPDTHPDWYGEIYVRYPLSPTITPMHLGHVMKATIDLRIVLNDISVAQFSSHEQTQLSHKQVLDFKRRLELVMQNLPTTLAPRNILLPCHFNVHTEYYMALHSLFQGQVAVAQQLVPASSQLFDGKSAIQLHREAYIRFETIMRIRYLRHGFDGYDAWSLLFLIYLGNYALSLLNSDIPDSAVKFTTTEVIRSTAVLCINGLVAQSQSGHAGTLLSRSMVERLKPVDKSLLDRHIIIGAGQIDQPFDSEWPMPNIKVERDEEASMNHVLKDVRKLSIVQEAAKQGTVPSS